VVFVNPLARSVFIITTILAVAIIAIIVIVQNAVTRAASKVVVCITPLTNRSFIVAIQSVVGVDNSSTIVASAIVIVIALLTHHDFAATAILDSIHILCLVAVIAVVARASGVIIATLAKHLVIELHDIIEFDNLATMDAIESDFNSDVFSFFHH
jgi:hypothetical protein